MERSSRFFFLPDSDFTSSSRLSTFLGETHELCSLILDILDLLAETCVPAVDLADIGISTSDRHDIDVQDTYERRGYALGGGYSAQVIRHTTQWTIGPLEQGQPWERISPEYPKKPVPEGTVVALKRFFPRVPSAGENEHWLETQTYDFIYREIKTFSQESLRLQENICSLLYVGWEESRHFPALALELAAFGTLEDVLVRSGLGPSKMQRYNLSLDIALGLAALHGVHTIHGDLKPGNILVQHHQDRQIVAKLSDFGGSFDLDGIHRSPAVGTEFWWAPEIVAGVPNIDWKRADVYAYGLVVASIFHHRPQADKLKSALFLEKFTYKHWDRDLRLNRVAFMKMSPDSSPDSVLQRSILNFRPLDQLFHSTLTIVPSRRKSMETLINEDLYHLCSKDSPVPWRIPNIPHLNDASEDSVASVKSNPRPFMVWSRAHRRRSQSYQRFIYKCLAESAQHLRRHFRVYLEDCVDQCDNIHAHIQQIAHAIAHQRTEDLDLLEQCAKLVEDIGSANPYANDTQRSHRENRRAYNIAMSQLLGVGTQTDEHKLVEWFYVAVFLGHPWAIWIAPLVQDSYKATSALKALRIPFLVVGSFIGCHISLRVLRQHHNDLYIAVKRTLYERSRPEFVEANAYACLRKLYHSPTIRPSTCGLREAIRSHNVDRATALLNDPTVDASVVDEQGRGILHHLTYMEDEEAATLARLCHQRGASLAVIAEEREHLPVFLHSSKFRGTPAHWAVVKNMCLYLRVLLDLHHENDIELPKAFEALFSASVGHNYRILDRLLDGIIRTPRIFSGFSQGPPSETLGRLLVGAMAKHYSHPLLRRIRHGAACDDAYKNTLQLLIEAGVDPFKFEYLEDSFVQGDADCKEEPAVQLGQQNQTTAERQAAREDDITAMQVFASRAKLWDGTEIANHISQSLQMCMLYNAEQCFHLLLDEFSSFDILGTQSDDLLAPLEAAARMDDPKWVRFLMQLGGHKAAKVREHLALSVSLVYASLETVMVIYDHTPEELRDIVLRFVDTETGVSVLQIIVLRCVSGRNAALLPLLQWVVLKVGAALKSDKHPGIPWNLWTPILNQRPPPLQEHARLDIKILEILFDLFSDRLCETDSKGLMPIHRAACNGNRGAIELLIGKGVDVNVETTDLPSSTSFASMTTYRGKTAIDFALLRSEADPPEDIRCGGRVEIRKWREQLTDLIQYLIQPGARNGRGASPSQQRKFLQYYPKTSLMVKVHYTDHDQENEADWGDDHWPLELPRDETSLQEDPAEIRQRRDVRRLLDAVLFLPSESLRMKMKETWEVYGAWLKENTQHRCQQLRGGNLPDSSTLQPMERTWLKWHNHNYDVTSACP